MKRLLAVRILLGAALPAIAACSRAPSPVNSTPAAPPVAKAPQPGPDLDWARVPGDLK